MKVKEAIVCKSAFPKPPINLGEPLFTYSGLTHAKVTQKVVFKAFMTQAATKAFGPNKMNFRILQMI